MNNWEKAKIIFIGLASILIPLVLGFVGNEYSSSIKERELQGKFVELAIKILTQDPTKENEHIRKWATDVVNLYSGVELNEITKNELIKKSPIYSFVDRFSSRIHLGAYKIQKGNLLLSVRQTYENPSKNSLRNSFRTCFDLASPIKGVVMINGVNVKSGIIEKHPLGGRKELKDKSMELIVKLKPNSVPSQVYVLIQLESNGSKYHFWMSKYIDTQEPINLVGIIDFK